jgi:OsmC-like protein
VESIRSAIEGASRHLTEHPEAAVDTDAAATAVHEDGLRFRVEGPKGGLTSDMSTSVGGGATAPTPAWLLRAALASCDATLVAMEAARDGVELTDLEVTVDSDSDFRGILGVRRGRDHVLPAGVGVSEANKAVVGRLIDDVLMAASST